MITIAGYGSFKKDDFITVTLIKNNKIVEISGFLVNSGISAGWEFAAITSGKGSLETRVRAIDIIKVTIGEFEEISEDEIEDHIYFDDEEIEEEPQIKKHYLGIND